VEIGSDVEENLNMYENHREDAQDDVEYDREIDLIQRALNKMDVDGFAVISRDKKIEKKNENIGTFEFTQFLAIRAYLQHRLRNMGKIEASRRAAQDIFDKFADFSYKMVCIRK
jgi:hypothetical protein